MALKREKTRASSETATEIFNVGGAKLPISGKPRDKRVVGN